MLRWRTLQIHIYLIQVDRLLNSRHCGPFQHCLLAGYAAEAGQACITIAVTLRAFTLALIITIAVHTPLYNSSMHSWRHSPTNCLYAGYAAEAGQACIMKAVTLDAFTPPSVIRAAVCTVCTVESFLMHSYILQLPSCWQCH